MRSLAAASRCSSRRRGFVPGSTRCCWRRAFPAARRCPVRGRNGCRRGGALRRRPGAGGPCHQVEIASGYAMMAEQNVRRNGFAESIRVIHGDVKDALRRDLADWPVHGTFSHAFANPLLRGRHDDAVAEHSQGNGDKLRAGRYRALGQGAQCHAGTTRNGDGDLSR